MHLLKRGGVADLLKHLGYISHCIVLQRRIWSFYVKGRRHR